MTKRQGDNLTDFIRDNCANYDRYYKSCLFRDSCLVMHGKRCGYFEKRVLGPADYRYKLPGYDYAKLFAQYAELTETVNDKEVIQRRCECGTPLTYRRRYCDRCARIRAKNAARDRKRKQRSSNSVNVTV